MWMALLSYVFLIRPLYFCTRWKSDQQKLLSVVTKSNGNLNTLMVAYDLLYIKLGEQNESLVLIAALLVGNAIAIW